MDAKTNGVMVTDEMADRALFSEAIIDGEPAGMLIDYMGMGRASQLDCARKIIRAAILAALSQEPQ